MADDNKIPTYTELGYDDLLQIPVNQSSDLQNRVETDLSLPAGSIDSDKISGTLTSGVLNIADRGWTSSLVFSSTDADTVAWAAAGVITASDGTSYTIDAGNTGNMAALTYIYLDVATSITVLQTTTTAATAVGSGKILIAVAQNNSDATSQAKFQVFGGSGGNTILVDNIAANSASTNEFVSNSAQIANLVVTNAKINDLAVSKLTAGSITSKAITLAIDAGTGDSKIQAGKTDFDNTQNGFIIGLDDSDSDKAKMYIGDSSTYMNWDGINMIVKAGTGSSIDFSYVAGATKPSDNATVGAVFGTNITGGGTSNKQCGNDGYITLMEQALYGDGIDGDLQISAGTTTLTTDTFYDNLIIDNGCYLNPNGYRVFVKTGVTGSGTIKKDGNNGGAGASGAVGGGGTGGTAGAALANGSIFGSVAGVAGATGVGGGANPAANGTAGTSGNNATHAIVVAGGAVGGNGGDALNKVGGTGGGGGTSTVAKNLPASIFSSGIQGYDITPTTVEWLDIKGGGGSGGSGAGGDSSGSGGGGGSGSNGSSSYIFAKTIVNTISFQANGGNGGAGGDGYYSGGGGGGAGGTGGFVLLVTGSNYAGTIIVNGGTGGPFGHKHNDPNLCQGTAGADGSAGTSKIIIF